VRWRAGAAALLAAATAAAGCQCRGRTRQSVDRVTVADTEAALALESIGLRREEVAALASAALRASPAFGPPAPESPEARHWLGRVEVHRADAVAGGGPTLAQVTLSFELSPRDAGGPMREFSRAAVPAAAGPRGLRDAFARAVEEALARAAGGFALLLAAEGKEEAALLADLKAPDARVRDAAVRVLAERKSREAVPALIDRLSDPDPAVVERAIGALGQIGDERAVVPLVRLAQRRQGAAIAQLARIIGDVGGPDARAYLVTLASGHRDPLVRGAAQQALDELEARAARGGAPAAPR
jgi:hypothetical protein